MNVYDVVTEFECEVAKYCGSKYAVATDSCTNALFLCCKLLEVKEVILPCRTYVGVAQSVINAGGKIKWKDYGWEGYYQIEYHNIIDSARHFKRNMYNEIGFHHYWHTGKGQQLFICLSFHWTKHIPIERGGMILTNDSDAVYKLRKMRFDGRTEKVKPKDDTFINGWHMMLSPSAALRGLELMSCVKDEYPDLEELEYPDLSLQEVFKCQK